VRFGDAVICPVITRAIIAMPTAIVMARTPRGFFIGADGKSRRDDAGALTPHRDNERKIFDIFDEHARFGFAVAATVWFTPDNNDADVIFDFRSQIPAAARDLARSRYHSAIDYCEKLADRVNDALGHSVRLAQRASKPVRYPSNGSADGEDVIAYLFLCGYYSNAPCGVVLYFSHRNQVLNKPRTVHRVGIGNPATYGSPAVLQQFPAIWTENTFDALASLTRDYVTACESPQGQAIDPAHCAGIGGDVHAGTVTADGFQWIKGFEYPEAT
jgi:hypothetical protein